MNALRKKLFCKAEDLNWEVNVYDKNKWEFEKYSPAGEDFIFTITADKPEDVWREVRRYANDFDQDEHIEMWVNARHNTSGVPSIRVLVEDAAEIEKMLDELADALQEVTEGETRDSKRKKATEAKWITFSLNGKEIAAISIKGSFSGEIDDTVKLLAYEKEVDTSEIVVGIR